jgi:hypothetical protein
MPITAKAPPVAPTSPVTEAAAATDADIAQGRQAEIGAGAPPATEPLDPVTLTVLGEAIAETAGSLSGGQTSLEAMDYTEPADQIPAPLFTLLVTLSEFFSQLPEAEPYRFDAFAAAASNAGLQDASIKISDAGQDKQLIRAMSAPMGAPAGEPAAEPAAPPPDKSRFISKAEPKDAR